MNPYAGYHHTPELVGIWGLTMESMSFAPLSCGRCTADP